MTWMTCSGCWRLLPTLGRSTRPVVISGALTMKMMSSTSITSMNGTMLISFIVRRRRPLPRLMVAAMSVHLGGVALQDVGELLDEGLQRDRAAVDLAREAVVGQHGRDRREQADGRRHQGLGDAWRDGGERDLGQVGQADEGVHDPPDRAEQADVGRDGTDGREEGQVAFHRIQLALEAGAHRAAGGVQQRAGVGHAALAQLQELAHAGRKDALQRRAVGAVAHRLVEVVEVFAAPELGLEGIVAALDLAQADQLAEDHAPARERHQQQAGDDELHREAGMQDQGDDGEVLVHADIAAATASGRRWGLRSWARTQPMRISPSHSSVSPRSARWCTTRLARPAGSGSTVMVSRSSSLAGAR
mmetsp:Transcript_53114/g.124167  ORF Transcript_53114/g.124167 Transcript_53114/m.124167 type:complete len:360 (-) Transcript_53114:2717-3796(-)